MPSQADVIQALRNASNGQDLAVPPPQSPADVAPFGQAMASAVGLSDAVKALKGQMTPEEAQSFALTSAMGLLPGAKAEGAAVKTMGGLFPKLFGKSSFAGLSPLEYVNSFGGSEAFAKKFPHTFSDLQEYLPQAAKVSGPNPILDPQIAGSPPTSLTDEAVAKALAKNPGASIFDIAGTNIEGPSTPWSKKPLPIGEANPQINIKDLSPEEEAARQQRMQQDYPTRLYHGVKPYQQFYGPGVINSDYLYMAENPELANLYAGVQGDKPYQGSGPGQVVPLQADLSKFHVYDAGGTPASSGDLWAEVNQNAIRQARKAGAPGVTIKNVYDEPVSTKVLGDPQTIHILLDKNWNKEQTDKFPLRSPFAMFDPSQYGVNNLLAGLAGGGAVAAPAVTPQVQDYIKALQGSGQDQQQ